MARRSRATSPVASVTWRDGVHLTGTPIWCDARRRRDVCFVSSADRVGKTGHGQLIGTPLTLALAGANGSGHLGVPLHRRFTLGTVRLELIESGRGPGAAALFVDITGKTILYAGTVRARAEVRTCEAVVVSAPYAGEVPPITKTIDRTIEWTAGELAAGRRPVLLVETAVDGLEVGLHLAAAGIALAGGRPIRDAAQRAGELAAEAICVGSTRTARDAQFRGVTPPNGTALPRALHIASPGKQPRAIIWLARDRGGAIRAAGGAAALATLAVDGEFPWVSSAGKADLLAWIEATRAREVYLTGAAADDLARTIGERARVIGPPHQMTLFEATP